MTIVPLKVVMILEGRAYINWLLFSKHSGYMRLMKTMEQAKIEIESQQSKYGKVNSLMQYTYVIKFY